jgi:cyanoexosortase A
MLQWLRHPPNRDRFSRVDLWGRLQSVKVWLLTLGLSLAGLHLLMLSRANQPEQLNTSLLLWLAVFFLIWERRTKLHLRSGRFASLLGTMLIGFVLLRTFSPAGYHLHVSPLLSVLGLGLLASGSKRLFDYWRELIILSLPIFSLVFKFGLEIIDLPILTAKFATYLLWFLGFEVQRQGVFILQPTGNVEVYSACSGVSSILQMLNLSVLFFLLFPTRLIQKGVCLIVAILIGFISNGIRVAIMAFLVAFSNPKAFEYWHGGQGSMIFSVIATLMLMGFCWLAFLRQPALESSYDP